MVKFHFGISDWKQQLTNEILDTILISDIVTIWEVIPELFPSMEKIL